MDTLESRSHHGSTFNKFCTLSYELCTVDDGGRPLRCSRPSIGRGCDRRKDDELLLARPRWWFVCDPRMIMVGKSVPRDIRA